MQQQKNSLSSHIEDTNLRLKSRDSHHQQKKPDVTVGLFRNLKQMLFCRIIHFGHTHVALVAQFGHFLAGAEEFVGLVREHFLN